MPTDVTRFIQELDAGVFEEKVSRALAEVSASVIDNNKTGSVTLKFDLQRIGSSYQVAVKHKLSYVKPTSKGKVSEENSTETPMHVGAKGYLSIFPENQTQLFTKTGGVDKQGSN